MRLLSLIKTNSDYTACLDNDDNDVQGNVQQKKTHVLLEMIVFTVIRTLTK